VRAPQARFNGLGFYGLGFYGLGFYGLGLLCPNRVGSGFQDTLFPQRRFHPHARQLDEFLSGFGRICLLGQFKAFTRVGVVLFRIWQHGGTQPGGDRATMNSGCVTLR
jgi:hypothetical protein